MTDAQQKFLITAPGVMALVLACNILDWTSQFRHADWTPIFIFYEDLDPLGHVEKWGLYSVWRTGRYPRRGRAALSLCCSGILGPQVALEDREPVSAQGKPPLP
jgi:hypothetical protein